MKLSIKNITSPRVSGTSLRGDDVLRTSLNSRARSLDKEPGDNNWKFPSKFLDSIVRLSFRLTLGRSLRNQRDESGKIGRNLRWQYRGKSLCNVSGHRRAYQLNLGNQNIMLARVSGTLPHRAGDDVRRACAKSSVRSQDKKPGDNTTERTKPATLSVATAISTFSVMLQHVRFYSPESTTSPLANFGGMAFGPSPST